MRLSGYLLFTLLPVAGTVATFNCGTFRLRTTSKVRSIDQQPRSRFERVGGFEARDASQIKAPPEPTVGGPRGAGCARGTRRSRGVLRGQASQSVVKAASRCICLSASLSPRTSTSRAPRTCPLERGSALKGQCDVTPRQLWSVTYSSRIARGSTPYHEHRR